MIYSEHFGKGAYLGRCRSRLPADDRGRAVSVERVSLLQGIETVALRVERHVENGRKVAEFLRDDDRIAWITYAGFPESPYYDLAQKYLGNNACSLMAVGLRGGYEAAVKFYDALKLIKRLVNLGDAKSLSCHPGLHHSPADVAGRATPGRRYAGNDSPQHRDRAQRRHHCRFEAGSRRHHHPGHYEGGS